MNSDVNYLLSLGAIRDRAQIVWQAAETGELSHFNFHEDKLSDVADFVISVIQVITHLFCRDMNAGTAS